MLVWLALSGVAVHVAALWLVHRFYAGADGWWLVSPFQYPHQHPRAMPKGVGSGRSSSGGGESGESDSVEQTSDSPARPQFQHDVFSDGQTADLPFSSTRYYLMGPENGRKIACLHGIGAPSVVFIHVAKHLVSLGMRVLVYGRGLSSTFAAVHDEKHYVAHLSTLLKHVGWKRFVLFGYSMGGAVSVAYSDAFPDEIEKLILFAPAGMMPHVPAMAKKQSVPGAQETMNAHDDQVDFHPGYLTAFLLCLRYFPASGMDEIYTRVGAHPRKTLVLWGTSDHVVPFETTASRVKQALPNATFVFLDDLNHNAMVEDPEHAFQAISDFLSD